MQVKTIDYIQYNTVKYIQKYALVSALAISAGGYIYI